MVLEFVKVIILLVGIWQLSQFGMQWASVAVGLAFGFNAIAGAWIVSQGDGPSPWRMTLAFTQPLMACVVMGLAVEGTYALLREVGIGNPLVHLLLGIAVGAASYVAAALVLCRSTSRDMIGLMREMLSRRRTS
jgi:hypothetical protein